MVIRNFFPSCKGVRLSHSDLHTATGVHLCACENKRASCDRLQYSVPVVFLYSAFLELTVSFRTFPLDFAARFGKCEQQQRQEMTTLDISLQTLRSLPIFTNLGPQIRAVRLFREDSTYRIQAMFDVGNS